MMTYKKIVLASLIVLSLIIPHISLAEEKVVVTGFSVFEPGNKGIAKEKALDHAKRSAVEEAFGTSIDSKTIIENFQVVRDQVLSRSSGYISKYTILEEKITNGDTYETTIEAVVEIPALVDDLDRLSELANWQKNPRISFMLDSDMNKNYLSTGKKIVSLAGRKFSDSGFKIFKYSKKKAEEMGLLVTFDIDVATSKSDYQGVELTLNEISLTSNILRPGDEEIIATTTCVKSIPGINKLQTIDKGARQCMDDSFRDLSRRLINMWEKELFNEREIYLTIQKIPNYNKAVEIASLFLVNVSNVGNADLIRFQNGKAEYSVNYSGWPEHFLSEIQMAYFKTKYFKSKLDKISGNHISITLSN